MNRLTFIKSLLIAPVITLLYGCEKDDKYAYFYCSPDETATGGLYRVRKEDAPTFLHICRNNPRIYQITPQEFKYKKLNFSNQISLLIHPYQKENEVIIYTT